MSGGSSVLASNQTSAPIPAIAWVGTIFAAAFAFLLAAFSARSPEIWINLVSGRSLLSSGDFSNTWAFDGSLFVAHTLMGPYGLVGLKAALLALAVGALAWRASKQAPNWALVLAFALAVLALGNSLALAPLAFSLVLSVGVLLATESMATSTFPRIWAIVCGLFWLACMHQVDERAGVAWLLGAMVLAGGLLDAKTANRPMLLPWLLIWLLLGPLLISFNPALGFKWILPPEFLLGGLGLQSSARSPFQPVNWDAILAVPSAMAYFPLLIAALLSALLPGKSIGMRWRLPTLVLALLSIWGDRWIPWLALVTGPCLALRLGAWANDGPAGKKLTPPIWLAPSVALVGLALLILAWPGWLQGAPHERRSLALNLPPAAANAAKTEMQWREKGLLPMESRGLHMRLSSLAAFSWSQPDLRQTLDFLQDDLVGLLTSRQGAEGLSRLCSEQKCHLVITEPDPARMQLILQGLVDHADKFGIWLVEGPIIIAGSNLVPQHPPALNWSEKAFDPQSKPVADSPDSPWPGPYPLTQSFTQPRPDATAGGLSAEGRHLLFLADIRRRQLAGLSSSLAWGTLAAQWLGSAVAPSITDQSAALAWLLATAPGPLSPGAADTAIPSPLVQALAGWKTSALPFPGEAEQRALLNLALRRAREAVALDPAEGRAWLVVGESCLRLLNSPSERNGANAFAEWRQLREAQAAFAFKRALIADPKLDLAHLNLAYLYSEMGLRDLEARHLRGGWVLANLRGPPSGMRPNDWRDRQTAQDNEIRRLESEVASRISALAREAAGRPALDRARLALDAGLGQVALDELLASDISAFGAQGMALEVDLLLRTGRADEVQGWMNESEHDGFLPPDLYHWFRVKAAAAMGLYTQACQEAIALTQGQTRLALPMAPSVALAVARDSLDRLATLGTGVAATWNRLPPNNIESQLGTMLSRWKLEMNGFAVLGLLSLERGDSTEGFSALRQALALSPAKLPENAGPALDFPARRLARSVLDMLTPIDNPARR